MNKTLLEKTFTNCHPICTLHYEFCFVTIFGVQTKIWIIFLARWKIGLLSFKSGKRQTTSDRTRALPQEQVVLLILSLVQARSGSFSWLCFFSIFHKKALKMLKCVFPQGHVTSFAIETNKKSRNYLILAGNFWKWVFGGKIFVEIANSGTLVFGSGGLPEIAELLPHYGDSTLHEAHTQWQTFFSKKINHKMEVLKTTLLP